MKISISYFSLQKKSRQIFHSFPFLINANEEGLAKTFSAEHRVIEISTYYLRSTTREKVAGSMQKYRKNEILNDLLTFI